MNIGVIGNGTVGHALSRCYMESHTVRVWDVVPEKATHSLNEVLRSDIVFLTLPTPQKAGSLECDLSTIEDFCNMLGGSVPNGNYVLRSTVPIGTTKALRKKYSLPNLVHSPEFLTARCAVTDAMLPARNIIGWKFAGKEWWECSPCGKILESLYLDRFPGIPVHTISSDESEAVKLFCNAFFATKIAFFNEINLLSEKMGLDWPTVLNGMLSDGRISHSHTQVPGPDGSYGFGGACLIKDLAMLGHQFNAALEATENLDPRCDGTMDLLNTVFWRNRESHRERKAQ